MCRSCSLQFSARQCLFNFPSGDSLAYFRGFFDGNIAETVKRLGHEARDVRERRQDGSCHIEAEEEDGDQDVYLGSVCEAGYESLDDHMYHYHIDYQMGG